MNNYEFRTEVIVITQDTDVLFDSEHTDVLGYSIEVPSDSANGVNISINGYPKLPIDVSGSREFGGVIGDMPVLTRDKVSITFTAAAAGNRALLTMIHIKCP